VNLLNWSTTSGGVGGATVPTSADIAIFDANSGGGTCTLAANTTVLAFNPAAYTGGTINFGGNTISVVGNAQIVYNGGTAPTMTGTPQVNLTYAGGIGTRTINGGIGVTEANAVSFNVVSGSDIVSMGGNGARLKNLTFQPAFIGSFTRASSGGLYGSLTLHAGMSFTATANTLTLAATTPQTITTGGLTVDCALNFNGIGGSWAFQDAIIQGSTRAFIITNGTVQLKAGATSTVGAFATSGTNQKFLQSTLASSRATLSQASGTVNASYLTIKDINATGGATWNAFATNNNVNAGNNLGWDFAVQLGRYIYTVRKNKRILF
jgi:hypothetical protein